MTAFTDAAPCKCGRRPKMKRYRSPFPGGTAMCELRCPRWFFKCVTVRLLVSDSSPFWRDRLVQAWNIGRGRPAGV